MANFPQTNVKDSETDARRDSVTLFQPVAAGLEAKCPNYGYNWNTDICWCLL